MYEYRCDERLKAEWPDLAPTRASASSSCLEFQDVGVKKDGHMLCPCQPTLKLPPFSSFQSHFQPVQVYGVVARELDAEW